MEMQRFYLTPFWMAIFKKTDKISAENAGEKEILLRQVGM
jgi:hypothetical protein